MGSHSITCHPTQVNTPCLSPAMQAGTRFTYPRGMEGWVDLVDLIAPWPRVEPATFRSWVRRWTAAPPRPRLIWDQSCRKTAVSDHKTGTQIPRLILIWSECSLTVVSCGFCSQERFHRQPDRRTGIWTFRLFVFQDGLNADMGRPRTLETTT